MVLVKARVVNWKDSTARRRKKKASKNPTKAPPDAVQKAVDREIRRLKEGL